MEAAKQAVVLCGGLGTRLKPYTEAIPKPLLPVGEKSILETQILGLKKYGFTDIFLATNYKSDYIQSFFGSGKRLGVQLTISKENRALGTCGPLALIKHYLKKPFIVMNGDILTTIDFGKLFQYALEAESDFTVVTKEIVMPFAFGNVYSKHNYITGVEEKPNIKHEVIAGIYVMKTGVFEYIPDNTYFGMDDLIRVMLKTKKPISRYLMQELWLDIGQPADYDKAQQLYDTHFRE
jgi:NDP-sugar pyrophosphorylase family protein